MRRRFRWHRPCDDPECPCHDDAADADTTGEDRAYEDYARRGDVTRDPHTQLPDLDPADVHAAGQEVTAGDVAGMLAYLADCWRGKVGDRPCVSRTWVDRDRALVHGEIEVCGEPERVEWCAEVRIGGPASPADPAETHAGPAYTAGDRPVGEESYAAWVSAGRATAGGYDDRCAGDDR